MRLTPPPPGSAWAPVLTVDNRHDFTDLAELAFAWRILESGASGDGSAAGGPHTAGCALTLHGLPADLVGTLEVNATSPRGFLINTWQFPLAAAASVAAPHAAGGGAPPAASLLADGRLQIQDAAGAFTWFVSPAGALSGNTSAGALLAGGPTLMVLDVSGEDAMQLTEGMPPILPFNDPLAGWAMTNRSWATVGNALQVVLTGTYTQAAGTFTLAFTSDARCACAFSFSWAGAPISPRQVGLVFDAPADLASLSWRRTTPWSAYPSDHIGRPAGDAVTPNAGPAPGAQPRNVSWARDAAPLGCADFRATKHNISAFQLASDDGLRAIALLSDGHSQHGRAWVGSAATQFLAATVSTEGGNPFSREKVLPQPTYTKGDGIAGVIVLQLGAAIKIEE